MLKKNLKTVFPVVLIVSNEMLCTTLASFSLPVWFWLQTCRANLMIKEGAETACYIGAILSALIAYRIFRMYDKTYINKMFLWYFTVDAFMGTLLTFLLFRVQGLVFNNKYEYQTLLITIKNVIGMRVRRFKKTNVLCSYQFGTSGSQIGNWSSLEWWSWGEVL